VIVTGTAGEATEGLLNDVRKAVAQIAGPYDNILVKSSVTVPQDIAVTVTVSNAPDNSQIENRVRTILTGLLAVRKGCRLHELTCSDINLAIRSGCDTATNPGYEVIIKAKRNPQKRIFRSRNSVFLNSREVTMETKNLTTLMTIIETGSFQRAATQLNYAPSTVTAQIKQLEDEFSLKLFERVGRRMELTQAGKDILPFVESILQNIEQISNYKKDLSDITGTLRLVAPDSIFIYIMQPVIKAILHDAPNIRLIINSLPSDDINQAIVNGYADIGVDCDKGNFPDTVMHPASKPFQACLIGSAFINPRELDFISPHQKKSVGMIYNEPNANYQKEITAYLAKKDIILTPDTKLQSIEAVKRSVMNNLGIAYVPRFSVEEELKNGSLLQ